MVIQKNSFSNIFTNLVKRGFLPVMMDKLRARIKEPGLKAQKEQSKTWCKSVGVSQQTYCESLDSELYKEALEYNSKLVNLTKERLKELPVKMGGAGDTTLAHFLVKHFNPRFILETGVSMGFTSRTFLEYLMETGNGKLYSSDFPYFRLENPEKYIGWVVPEDYKKHWELEIDGDAVNLPRLLSKIDHIDLYHYDSDKSYRGRQRAWELVLPALKEDSIIVFDDIHDNLHFKEKMFDVFQNVHVLESRAGGYVGLIIGLDKRLDN